MPTMKCPHCGKEINLKENFEKLVTEARKIVKEYDAVATSLLQRKLEIDYATADKVMRELVRQKVVGQKGKNGIRLVAHQ